jgi:hypothetical protein
VVAAAELPARALAAAQPRLRKGVLAPNCCTRRADGGSYGGGKDSFSICFYCYKTGVLSCCSNCPVTHCAEPACTAKFEKHKSPTDAGLNADSIFAFLRAQSAFFDTSHEHSLTLRSFPVGQERYCDVCGIRQRSMWHCDECDSLNLNEEHDECELCHDRRERNA